MEEEKACGYGGERLLVTGVALVVPGLMSHRGGRLGGRKSTREERNAVPGLDGRLKVELLLYSLLL